MTAATDAAAEVVEEVVSTDAGKAVAVALGIAAGCVVVAWAARRIGEAADAATEPVRAQMWQAYTPPPAYVEDQSDEDQGDEDDDEDGADDGGFVR